MRRLARTYGPDSSQLRRVEPAPVVRATASSYTSQAVAAASGRISLVSTTPQRGLRPLRNGSGF